MKTYSVPTWSRADAQPDKDKEKLVVLHARYILGTHSINLLEINNAYIRTKGTVWAESHGEAIPLRALNCISVPDANGQDVFLYVKVQIADDLEHAIAQGHVGIDVACLSNILKARATFPVRLTARDAGFRRFV